MATFVQLLTPQAESAATTPAASAVPKEEEIEPSWREKVEADIAELRAEMDRLKKALGEE